MSEIEKQVREMIARYVIGQISIDKFWAWLSGCAWDIEDYEDKTAEAITYDAMTLMAEFQHKHRDEASLRAELRKHVLTTVPDKTTSSSVASVWDFFVSSLQPLSPVSRSAAQSG